MPIIKDKYKAILRDYQLTAVEFMIKHRAALMYDDMGLGKTLSTLVAIDSLEALPCIIVCPKFALTVWEVEIEKWLGMKSTIYSGKPKERKEQWKQFITRGDKFLITNYAMAAEIGLRSGLKITECATAIKEPGIWKWNSIIWDEAHVGGLFKYTNSAYKVAHKFASTIPVRYVLTGTPYRQGCVDLFGPLSLVDMVKFKNYWSYVNTYCVVTKTPFGKEIERNPANLITFRKMLNEYMVRRIKEEVLTELPGKLRQCLFIEMNSEQHALYDELTSELIAIVKETGDLLITPNQLTLMVRQRQILACPQVLGLKHRGAAIDTIMEHSHLTLDENKPVSVFTPFRKAIPCLERAFKEEYPHCMVYIIQGQMTAAEFGATWQGFQNDPYKQKVLLCVIKSGASFQATCCDTSYFLGYEWDFNLNEQAEDRHNRMGQKNFVNIFYLMTKGTVDEEVASRLNEKKTSSNWVVGTETQFLKMLQQTQRKKK
jgi:SNF2 family DNA or RNA helicase